MSGDDLSRTLPMLLVVGLVVLFLWYRARRPNRGGKAEIFYATHCEAAETATPDLLRVFDGMLPQELDGVSLLRLSLLNRGEQPATVESFLRPVRVTLPVESRILSAGAVQKTGSAQFQAVSVSATLNQVEIEPFLLPPRSSVIFNIVVDGTVYPHHVDGALEGQSELQRLA